ncbi:HAD hydrolase family protein [Desulfovibrio mangrovi]|uniref:KdsC family phosphatase n=1 Tax=Desulfovibrio mangrovi TaxID=2976983 RepID=UPI0022477F90|nr:HAD hydrolase family protein [Desulfovibrio mangrovi]UZP68248.1 HAD hydrolase family protein [Desulfovibrio mangrovi]
MRAEQLAKEIKVIVLDCDGVLTDGGLYYDAEGKVTKRFNVQDGLGIKVVQKVGIPVAVITGLESDAVKARITTLGIDDYFSGFLDKMDCLEIIRSKYGITMQNIAYVGDDWVDLGPMRAVGLPIAVANAQPETKDVARFVTQSRGGDGAVREVIRFILKAQGKLEQAMSRWNV